MREEFLAKGISPEALAKALQVPLTQLQEIVREQRDLTPEMAMRLAKYLHTPEEFWTELQVAHDVARVRRLMRQRLAEGEEAA